MKHNYIYDIIYENVCKVVHRCTSDDDIYNEINFIVKKYNEPHRKYHNINHIIKCFDVLNNIKMNEMVNSKSFKPCIIFAILYHDIIYDIYKKDNEYQSANQFDKKKHYWGISDSDSIKIMHMIKSTTHKPISQISQFGNYKTYMCDIDLAQLGCGRYEFLDNEELIRKEYKFVPDDIFYTERYKILTNFVNRKFIYYNKNMRNLYEEKARKNIKYVLDRQDVFSSE